MSVLLAVPSLLFSTTIDQPQVHLIKDQLNLIKFDDNDNDDNFDNDSHDEVINSEPIQKSWKSGKNDQGRTACLMIWPDGNPAESLMDHVYQVVKKSSSPGKMLTRLLEKLPSSW